MGKKTEGKEFRDKAGLGRVKEIWRTWAEIEREEKERANKGKEMDVRRGRMRGEGEGKGIGEVRKNGFLCKPRKGHGERGGRTEGGE